MGSAGSGKDFRPHPCWPSSWRTRALGTLWKPYWTWSGSAQRSALALSANLPGWSIALVVLVRQGRVTIGDPIGLALGARAVVVLIGERPGLSAADRLSAYLTWNPKPGWPDSERNCVSNIRAPGGLAPNQAASKIAWLLRKAARLGFTGVLLKDRASSEEPVAMLT